VDAHGCAQLGAALAAAVADQVAELAPATTSSG
jgi:hypothetical protein